MKKHHILAFDGEELLGSCEYVIYTLNGCGIFIDSDGRKLCITTDDIKTPLALTHDYNAIMRKMTVTDIMPMQKILKGVSFKVVT